MDWFVDAVHVEGARFRGKQESSLLYLNQINPDHMQLLSHDTVAKIREKMLGCVFDLLYRKPEQEQELLSQLTNKLGDPVKRVSSKAILFLLKLGMEACWEL